MSLERYIRQRNKICNMFIAAQQPMHIDRLTPEDMQQLAQQLAIDLDPASLVLDGETRGKPLGTKRAILNQAATELKALGAEVEIY